MPHPSSRKKRLLIRRLRRLILRRSDRLDFLRGPGDRLKDEQRRRVGLWDMHFWMCWHASPARENPEPETCTEDAGSS